MRLTRADASHDADAVLLLVSEEPPARLVARLEEVGWQVLAAPSADEGVQLLLANERIRVALVDDPVGELDALEIARMVRQRVRSRSVLMLLLVPDDELQTTLLRACTFGAVEVLGRSAPLGLILARLASLLELALRLWALERREARMLELERAALAGEHLRLETQDEATEPNVHAGRSIESTPRPTTSGPIEELRRELQQANRTREEFLAVISHELRTPLNAILGWTQILRTHPFDEPGLGRALATIERNAKFQAQLIDDLLDFSKMLAGKLRLEERRIDLVAVLEAAAESVRPSLRSKGIQLRLDIDRSLPETIGDPLRLQQVVCNLLTNALKFTPPGGHIVLELRPHAGGLEALIAVHDDGEGIAPEFLPHVFERFRQGDTSTTRRQGGLGLGLAIVRHLVTLHGGRVAAHSPGKGQGTTVTVCLPLREATPSMPKPTGRFLIAEAVLQDLTIVLIDDDEDGREVMSLALESKGCRVMSMGSVSEAMAWLRSPEGAPDLILTDLSMPDEDGFALLRQVRTLPGPRGSVPVIAVSALRAEETERRAVTDGFAAYIHKPVDCDLLVGSIARVIFRGRYGSGVDAVIGRASRSAGPSLG